MLKIAGKLVIDYVMEDLQALGNVDQVIYITGHLKEKVEEYARAKYPFPSVFVEQKEQRGTADAVALARPYIDEPVMIIFVDTIFDADFSVVDPAYIEDGVTLEASKIGPNVSVSAGSTIEDSELRDTIVGSKCLVRRSSLQNSMVGDEAVVEGIRGEMTNADHSEVRGRG